MPNIKPIDVAQATGTTAQLLAGAKAKLGKVPNMFATLAHSPAALQTYFRVSDTLAEGRFSAKQRELIALAVGEANACGYCLAAHTAIGGLVGLKPDEIESARDGRHPDARDAALVQLAARIVETRGNLTSAEVAQFKARGLTDADILETIAVVALNIFTNYVNHIAGTEVDFPAVTLRKAA